MNRIRVALLAPAVLLAGCDSFVSPPVGCDEVVVSAGAKLTSQRKGLACAFPEALLVTVAHAPRVDPSKCEEDCGEVSSLSLVGSTVTVVSGGGAILLCPGASCIPSITDPNASQVEQVIDEKGTLSYRALVVLEGFGLPGPGGTSTYEGALATESYRPGNSCPIQLKLSLECAEATETTE